jgi:hypothetical protein
LSYYQAPAGQDTAWELVQREWPPAHGNVLRPEPGKDFPSFFLFAFFALARWQQLPTSEQTFPPEASFSALQTALSAYDAVRTGRAHGLYLTSKRERDSYFALIDRWLTSLLAACPEHVTREELLEVTEPLPVVAANGLVSW